MLRTAGCLVVIALFVTDGVEAEETALSRPGTTITRSTAIVPGQYRLLDDTGDGALRIVGDDLTVDFKGADLIGSPSGQSSDKFSGKGITLSGKGITLRNAKVRGYKVGIFASNCPGLVLEDIDVSGNYQQHLRSTSEAEDGADWLFPHNNDSTKWIDQYGAGLCVERSKDVTLRRVRCRHGQNGIVLDRVDDSRVYDNDCSFISGWGLAMWRSNRNVITRNAFDFCVRGYSHGVYNRGQDSAGILMFEQNSDNVIAENSATHGGDGFFGFGGHEALGQKPPSSEDFDYHRRGNNRNLLIDNDFSYAVAHGIEMTFSFDNRFINNRLVGNGICGVWGGYSQDTLIAGNTFEDNGEMAYGLERGGINIEHGSGNVFEHNTFRNNKCGIHLWWDNDEGLLKLPWAKVNHKGSTANVIRYNVFEKDRVAIHLRETTDTRIVSNRMIDVEKEIEADSKSETKAVYRQIPKRQPTKDYPVLGETRPVGARKQLRGRQYIMMTEWGPYDFTDYMILPERILGGEKALVQILGPDGDYRVTAVEGNVDVTPREGRLPGTLTVSALKPGMQSFSIAVEAGKKNLRAEGTLLAAEWEVQFFGWIPDEQDPRHHPDEWKKVIGGKPIDQRTVPAIDFRWQTGSLGPRLPHDNFATVATTSLQVPAGRYRIWTISDDGIRVWIDNELVIEDWTWHPPKENEARVELEAGVREIRIEHFEIDGFAQLQFRLEPLP